jgi:hypothetical protein
LKKSLKILVVVESIDINDSSGIKGRVALIRNMAQVGYTLRVYHYTRRNISLSGIDCIAIPEQKWTLNYIFSKFQLLLRRLTGYNLNPWVERKRGFSFAFFNDSYSIKKALKKEKDFEPDWVLTLSKAASFRTHKAVLGIPKWHQKWLAYVHDPYPMHFFPRPYTWVQFGYLDKQEFFRDISKKMAYGIFPSKLLMEWMGSYYPDFLERGIVVPHQMLNSSNENKSDIPKSSFFKPAYFSILHAGSLMKPRNPKGLVEGFQQFLRNFPEAAGHSQLLLIGKQSYFEDYLLKKKNEISQLYVSEGYVPYEEVRTIQNCVSVNVILEAKSEISPFLPGKFPHCVAANKPIIHLGPKVSETRRILGENYPYWAEIEDTEEIAKIISLLYQRWCENNNLKLNRPDVARYLSADTLKEILNTYLNP